MGQKSNPISLRSSFKKNLWTSKYLANRDRDLPLFLSQDLFLREYLDRFFNIHGLILYRLNLYRTQHCIKIFLSYLSTSSSVKLFKIRKRRSKRKLFLKKKKKKKILKKIIFLRKSIRKSKFFFSSSKRSVLILNRKIYFLFKFLKKKSIMLKKNFIYKLLSCLHLFFNKRHNIKIILQNTNKGFSHRLKNKESFILRKLVLNSRFYSRFEFFRESLHVLLHVIKVKHSSKVLTDFISLKLSILKKHNFFLTFLRRLLISLMKLNISVIKGIKVKITGRFNGAPRARSRMFKVHKIPLQNLDTPIDVSQSVSFTGNGTFGVTAWVSY